MITGILIRMILFYFIVSLKRIGRVIIPLKVWVNTRGFTVETICKVKTSNINDNYSSKSYFFLLLNGPEL